MRSELQNTSGTTWAERTPRSERTSGSEWSWRQRIFGTLLLLAIGVGCGLVTNQVQPEPLPLNYQQARDELRRQEVATANVPTAELAEAKSAFDAGSAILVDARARGDYVKGHIPGALSLPVADFQQDFSAVAPVLGRDAAIICYCGGHTCDKSIELAIKLKALGFKHVHAFVGGWDEWTRAGYPVVSGPPPQFPAPSKSAAGKS